MVRVHTHTHTHPNNGPMSRTTQVSRYQKGKTNLDFTGARDGEWQWHQLGHMQVCTSLLSVCLSRMPFLSPNQQCQSTEGNRSYGKSKNVKMYYFSLSLSSLYC